MAEKLNISQQQISRYERGLSVLSPDVMLRYCAALGMTEREISELFSIISTHYQSVISGPEGQMTLITCNADYPTVMTLPLRVYLISPTFFCLMTSECC